MTRLNKLGEFSPERADVSELNSKLLESTDASARIVDGAESSVATAIPSVENIESNGSRPLSSPVDSPQGLSQQENGEGSFGINWRCRQRTDVPCVGGFRPCGLASTNPVPGLLPDQVPHQLPSASLVLATTAPVGSTGFAMDKHLFNTYSSSLGMWGGGGSIAAGPSTSNLPLAGPRFNVLGLDRPRLATHAQRVDSFGRPGSLRTAPGTVDTSPSQSTKVVLAQERGLSSGKQKDLLPLSSDATAGAPGMEGFERAKNSLESGGDFDFWGDERSSSLDPLGSRRGFGQARVLSGSSVPDVLSPGAGAVRSEITEESRSQRPFSSGRGGESEDGQGAGPSTSNSVAYRPGSRPRRRGRNRQKDRRHVSAEGGPVFHPLPSLFSYPPQSLLPWLPTAGVRKDMPTVSMLHSCRMESRMVSEYTDSHQAMSLMLALPGLPISQAPMLTLQQAANILKVINEPLAVLKVGRMTKSVAPNPSQLKATEDVGILTLWLSPTSDIKVIWHSLKHPAPNGQEPVEWEMLDSETLFPSEDGAPFQELFCYAEASEELACIEGQNNKSPQNKQMGVHLEMIEQDPSGRSFRLTRQSSHVRQRRDLSMKLDVERLKSGGRVSRETAKLQALLRACTAQPDQEENLFFWIMESSLTKGKQVLKDMQSQLDHTPTLSERSGVPEKKLQEVYDCFAEATRVMNMGNSSESAESSFNAPNQSPPSWFGFGPGMAAPSHLFAMGSPTTLFEHMAKSTSRSRGMSRGGSSGSTGSSRSASPSLSDCRSNNSSDGSVSDSCVLSATANFLVSDKRWNLTHLSTVTVTVAVGVASTGEVVDKEASQKVARECAHELAKRRAESGAQAEAERLGRRRLEELAAEKAAKMSFSELGIGLNLGGIPAAVKRLLDGGSGDEGPPHPNAGPHHAPVPELQPRSQSGPIPRHVQASIRPSDAPNHWRSSSGPLLQNPRFVPQNMYIPRFSRRGDARGDGVMERFTDTHSNLGLGFGSGPQAMRNGQMPDGQEARPPGYNYGQWQADHTVMKQMYARSPNARARSVPVVAPGTRSWPWIQPVRRFGPNYRGDFRAPRATMLRSALPAAGLYPRHLPPVLPYLDMVNFMPQNPHWGSLGPGTSSSNFREFSLKGSGSCGPGSSRQSSSFESLRSTDEVRKSLDEDGSSTGPVRQYHNSRGMA
ncbi:hypothetical protein BSKO_11425 [Bryopsis sp. KO-2023]|nr:hypothetical protein BSKO_11425 [Bryopsis sp. KO-2023]